MTDNEKLAAIAAAAVVVGSAITVGAVTLAKKLNKDDRAERLMTAIADNAPTATLKKIVNQK